MLKSKDKHYISELDRFLFEFAEQHPEASDSQRKEWKKHDRINQLRDRPQQGNSDDIWRDF